MISKVFRRGIHLLAMIALVGVFPSAYATTLREVVQHTVCTNPDVLIRTRVKRASNENVKMAYARYLPVVDFNFGVGREKADNSNTRFEPRTLWRRNLGVLLRQNLFEGFTTLYEICRTKAKTDADAYQVQGTAQDQALFAVETYLNILRAKERVAVAEDNLQTHQRIFSMIKKRSQSGVGREADIAQVTGRLALAQSNLYAAQNDVKIAKVNFYRITGLTSDHLTMPREPSDSLIPNTIELAMYKALKNHPKMHVAVTDVEEARAQHNVSHATAFPVVDVVLAAQNDHNVNGTEGHDNHYAAALELHYNLFRGGHDVARQRETAYFTQEAAEIRNRTCRETKENVSLAWNNLQTARKRLPPLYQHKVSSVKTAIAYHDQFRLGKRTLLDLLDTENERFRSAEEYIDGKYEILINKFRIIQGMGQLTHYLHVTIPEEGNPEYGLYHPEANPVVVKRHIEARIPARDFPSSLYHSDEPPHVHAHEHHPHGHPVRGHHGRHHHHGVSTNPRHTQVVSNDPRHFQKVATNPQHTRRVSDDPSHFKPANTDPRYTRSDASRQKQPQRTANNQNHGFNKRAQVTPRRMVHFGNRHQQAKFQQQQQRANTFSQKATTSKRQFAQGTSNLLSTAQPQQNIIPKQTIAAYQHDKPQLERAQQREASTAHQQATAKNKVTKTTHFTAQPSLSPSSSSQPQQQTAAATQSNFDGLSQPSWQQTPQVQTTASKVESQINHPSTAQQSQATVNKQQSHPQQFVPQQFNQQHAKAQPQPQFTPKQHAQVQHQFSQPKPSQQAKTQHQQQWQQKTIANQQAHHWQQRPTFDVKPTNDFTPNQPKFSHQHHSNFQQQQHKTQASNKQFKQHHELGPRHRQEQQWQQRIQSNTLGQHAPSGNHSAQQAHKSQFNQHSPFRQHAKFRQHRQQQQAQFKHQASNQFHPLKEAEGLSTQLPKGFVKHQNNGQHGQLKLQQRAQNQHKKSARYSYDSDQPKPQPSFEKYKSQFSAHSERKLPHQRSITSASHPSFDEARLQRQWEEANRREHARLQQHTQPQPKPKQTAQVQRPQPKPKQTAQVRHRPQPKPRQTAQTRRQPAQPAEQSSNLQAKFSQEVQQLREAQASFSHQQTQFLKQQAKAQKQWQEQQAKAHQQFLQQQAQAQQQQKQQQKAQQQQAQRQQRAARKVVKSGPELTGWAVQLGTFKDQGEVNNLVVKLRKGGMNGFMREIQTHNGTTFEVFVGPTKQRSEADNLVRKLQSIQLGGSVVRADI